MEQLIEHLQNVYTCLAISTFVSGLGLVTIGLFVTSALKLVLLSSVGSAISFLLLLVTRDIPDKNRPTRMGYMLSFAACTGIGMTSLIKEVFKKDPTLISLSFVESVVVFACLSACAIFSVRGRFLFLGIPLTVLLFTLIVLSYANILENSYWVSKALVYMTLFTMCGLVLYDTQLILERYFNGDKDFIQQTLNVFTDFMGIYRRLMILGMDKRERETDERMESEEPWLEYLRPNAPINALA